MSKFHLYLLRLLITTGLVISPPLSLVLKAYAQTNTQDSVQYEKELKEARDRILDLFGKKVKADRLYSSRNDCYSIEIEDIYEGVAQIVIREKENNNCPAVSGKPAILDRFIANPVGDEFEWYWLKDDGETEPYENAVKRNR